MARALEVSPSLLQRWWQEFRESPGKAFPGTGNRRLDADRVAQLERKIGQQTLEIDFLKGCLQRIEQQRQAAGHDWKAVVYQQIQSQRSRAAV